MTRNEHMQWAKTRALEYVNTGDFAGAFASMLSDLGKHPETESSSTGICAQLGMMELMRGPTKESFTRFITGFN